MQVVLNSSPTHNVTSVRMALATDFSLHELHPHIATEREARSQMSPHDVGEPAVRQGGAMRNNHTCSDLGAHETIKACSATAENEIRIQDLSQHIPD